MNTQPSAKRVDASGKAFKGSQYQLQRYVNEFPSELERALRATIPDLAGSTITWRSPIASDGYREYRDAAFLDRIGLTELRPALLEFWPRGGPVWDGLAQVGSDPPTGVLLVEAKS
jgi:hypothetical protein